MSTVTATNIVKSFNMAKVGLAKLDLVDYVKKNPGASPLIDVLAFATSYEVIPNKKDNTKSSLKFTGNFEIINRITGEEVNAPQAFFPGPAEMFLKGALDGNEGSGVRLAFQVTVAKDPAPDSITGYKFGMKLYSDKTKTNDPFAEIRGVFPPIVKAIKKN